VLKSFAVHRKKTSCADFCGDNVLITGGNDGVLRLWDVRMMASGDGAAASSESGAVSSKFASRATLVCDGVCNSGKLSLE
jgi:WD40 repeat protein